MNWTYTAMALVLGGIMVSGAILEWEWMFQRSNARFWRKLIGKTPLRLFYVILGLCFFLVGWASLLGLFS